MTVISAAPFIPPKQETGVILFTAMVGPLELEMSASAKEKHPLPSVTLILYTPLESPATESTVSPVVQSKEKGGTDPGPVIEATAVPLERPQEVLVTVTVSGIARAELTEIVFVFTQPFISVPVTVYEVPVLGLTLILAVVSPVFHKYVLPPEAVSNAAVPLQMVEEPLIEIEGREFIFTTTASVAVPQEFVTSTEYEIVVVGFATGFAQVVQLSPVAGYHVKDPFPVALRPTDEPKQIDTSAPAFATATGFIVTVTVAVLVHPPALVPVTV